MAEYYVYELIDPRNNKPFYIGKGKGDRIDHHEKEARKSQSTAKTKLIAEIELEGLSIVKNIVKRFKSENAAYKYEEKLIKKIGLENLTNVAPGGKWTAPYFFKKDDKKELYKTWISLFIMFIRKSGKNGEYGIEIAGKRQPLPDGFFPALKKKVSEAIDEYGWNWVVKEFKKHNIILQLVSKVENHG